MMRARTALLAVIFLAGAALASPVLAAGNRPPAFLSTPPAKATVGEFFFYDTNASDPDGDQITYYLTQKFDDMNITPDSGVFTWNPVNAGNLTISIYATDGLSQPTPQTFTVSVAPRKNSPPNFTSQPVKVATVGVLYTYDVNVTDPDGDKIFFSLDRSPKGMAIDQLTGVVTWMPTDEYVNQGVFVSVIARDSATLTNMQAFVIDVKKLNATVNHPPTPRGSLVTNATANQLYTCTIDATDLDGDPIGYSLAMGAPNMTINSTTGVIRWTPGSASIGQSISVRVMISDGKENTTLNYSIVVRDRAKPPAVTDPAGQLNREPDMICIFTFVFAALCYVGAWAVAYLKREPQYKTPQRALSQYPTEPIRRPPQPPARPSQRTPPPPAATQRPPPRRY
jgi:hypothetical protein